jgi:hypothetical protein
LFATVIPEKLASQELDASVGASGPHDFAVRKSALSSVAWFASTASRPNVRDDGQRPSVGQDDSFLLLFLPGRQAVIRKIRNLRHPQGDIGAEAPDLKSVGNPACQITVEFGREGFFHAALGCWRYIKMSRKGALVVHCRVGPKFWRINSVTIGWNPFGLSRPSYPSGGMAYEFSWRRAKRRCTGAFEAITKDNRAGAAGAQFRYCWTRRKICQHRSCQGSRGALGNTGNRSDAGVCGQTRWGWTISASGDEPWRFARSKGAKFLSRN